MEEKKLLFVMMLVVSTFLGGLGQLLFKIGLLQGVLSQLALYLILGLVVYGISTTIYLYVLSRRHLSWVYGLGGLSYIFAGLLAFLVLGESPAPLRIIGIALIAVGTLLVGWS